MVSLRRLIYRIIRKKRKVKLGIYGAPNVGKTTLANRIAMDWKGTIVGRVSEVPHETRKVQGMENVLIKVNGGEIALDILDMPGISTKLDYRDFLDYGIDVIEARERAKEATKGVIEAIKWLEHVDAVLAVMDSTKDPFNQVNITILGNLEARGIPVIIVANKIDLPEAKPNMIKVAFPQHPVIPISALSGENVDKLYMEIVRKLG